MKRSKHVGVIISVFKVFYVKVMLVRFLVDNRSERILILRVGLLYLVELILFVRESEKTEKDLFVCCPQTRAMKNVLKPFLNKAEIEHRISFENLLTADI